MSHNHASATRSGRAPKLAPKMLTFDVFGTLTNNWEGSIEAFRSILHECGGAHIDARQFQGYWEERNIAHYRDPYRRYREIAELSLAEAFDHFGIRGHTRSIQRYFDTFSGFELYPDVARTLDILSRQYKLGVVSNIDDDLLKATPLSREFDLVCTAERARGYKPDGTLFRFLIEHAGVEKDEILHSGQSQFTDMVGAKPLGLTVAWINRRGLALHPSVPKPDYVFSTIASLIPLLESGP
jgi:2-haloacid dehalogenase